MAAIYHLVFHYLLRYLSNRPVYEIEFVSRRSEITIEFETFSNVNARYAACSGFL